MSDRRVHASFVRPLLVAGAEREPGMVVIFAAGGLLVFGITHLALYQIGAGLFLLFVTMPILQRIAKHDPHAFKVYGRYVVYSRRYPARTSAAVQR